MILAENIALVRAQIADAAQRAGRGAEEITLVGVTKTIEAARIAEAYEAGLRDFGENYLQESLAKVRDPRLALAAAQEGNTRLRWHFIGHLQSNKARDVADLFTLVHSVDTLALARELGRRAKPQGKALQILLQIKIDPAETKFGVAPEEALAFAERLMVLDGVRLCGLMGLAPFGETPEVARPAFRRLRSLFDRLPEEARQTLSMGMSGDFQVAIEEGSTLVRIGTALFGSRSP